MTSESRRVGKATLEVREGDITKVEADAIVNAANTHLQHGGGVAAAISRAGGPAVQEESDRIGHCSTGSAVATGAGDLPAKWVVHAVGPRMGEGDEDAKLVSATRAALRVAEEQDARSVALPAISTGIYGFPMERAASLMVTEARRYLEEEDTALERVTFVLFGPPAFDAFARVLADVAAEVRSGGTV